MGIRHREVPHKFMSVSQCPFVTICISSKFPSFIDGIVIKYDF